MLTTSTTQPSTSVSTKTNARRAPPRRSANTTPITTMPTTRSSQAAREYENSTPQNSAARPSSLRKRPERSSRGSIVSCSNSSSAGTRNGPNTFGSLNSARARVPVYAVSDSWPGNGRNSAAEPIAALRTAVPM